MLDSANCNTSTANITKSVRIQAVSGASGSIVGFAPAAIEIAPADVVVALRNLDIGPFGGHGHGILVHGDGGKVSVEKCAIAGLGGSGIVLRGSSRLHVLDDVQDAPST